MEQEQGEEKKEALHAIANDARLINATDHLLFPLLEKGKKEATELLCSKFRGGDTELLADIARITVFDDLIKKIKHIQLKGNTARGELENGNS